MTKYNAMAAIEETSRTGYHSLVLYINSQPLENKRKKQSGLKTTSVTDDVIDWFLLNKILGCATRLMSNELGAPT